MRLARDRQKAGLSNVLCYKRALAKKKIKASLTAFFFRGRASLQCTLVLFFFFWQTKKKEKTYFSYSFFGQSVPSQEPCLQNCLHKDLPKLTLLKTYLAKNAPC